MGSQMLLLNWNEHKSNVIGEFQQLFSRSELTDVTLACDGFSLEAHKAVLSASSAFFRSLFLHRPCEHAFVILTDMDSDGLKAIVDFMYQGQIHISQEKLTQFLKTAEKLKIKGLSTFSQDESPNLLEEPVTACSRSDSLEHTELSSKRQSAIRPHLDNSFQALEQTESSSKRQPTVRPHLDNSFQALEQTESSSKRKPTVRPHLDNSFQPLEQTEPSSKRQPTVRPHLDNSFQSLEQTELSSKRQPPVRPHLDTLFQTNETRQQELSLTSGGTNETEQPELSLNSASYRTLKNESCDITPPVHEYCSTDLLEPNFSPSLHNIPSSSNEISQNQSITMPVQSISQETSQWVSQIFPSDNIQSATAFQTKPANCKMGSTSGSKLIGTQKSSNSSKVYPVHISNFEAISGSRMKTRDKPLTAVSTLHCFICMKIFNSKSSLIAHQNTHIEEKQLRCGVCSKIFKQKQGLEHHLRSHSGEKPYSCNICNKKFTSKGSVTVHKRLHTGEKPFHCKYCKKRFSDRTSWVVHERMHTKEKPFCCKVCWKTFSSSANLKQHSVQHFAKNRSVILQSSIS